jgi:hypothetical protein
MNSSGFSFKPARRVKGIYGPGKACKHHCDTQWMKRKEHAFRRQLNEKSRVTKEKKKKRKKKKLRLSASI